MFLFKLSLESFFDISQPKKLCLSFDGKLSYDTRSQNLYKYSELGRNFLSCDVTKLGSLPKNQVNCNRLTYSLAYFIYKHAQNIQNAMDTNVLFHSISLIKKRKFSTQIIFLGFFVSTEVLCKHTKERYSVECKFSQPTRTLWNVTNILNWRVNIF